MDLAAPRDSLIRLSELAVPFGPRPATVDSHLGVIGIRIPSRPLYSMTGTETPLTGRDHDHDAGVALAGRPRVADQFPFAAEDSAELIVMVISPAELITDIGPEWQRPSPKGLTCGHT